MSPKQNKTISDREKKVNSSLDNVEISPFIKNMATGKNIPIDLDYKKEYAKFKEEKYK